MIVKNRRGVDFHTHVVATTPEDSSSRRRIWRYGERSFPSMRTASFRGFFTSGRRSRGRRSDLLKLPIDECATGEHRCDVKAVCKNTPGSFTCSCSSPYHGDGFTCQCTKNRIMCDDFSHLRLCSLRKQLTFRDATTAKRSETSADSHIALLLRCG